MKVDGIAGRMAAFGDLAGYKVSKPLGFGSFHRSVEDETQAQPLAKS